MKSIAVPGLRGKRVNVGAGERLLSVFAGGALAAAAVRKEKWPAAAMAVSSAALVWRGFSGNCPAYTAASINTAEPEHTSQRTEHAVTVNQSPEKLYAFWRNFGNLPQIMDNLESVRILDDARSVWTVKGPAGKSVQWEAVVTNDIPNERIEWQTTDNAAVSNTGTVTFRRVPGERGTEVRVVVEYQPPAGRIGEGVARLFGRSARQEIGEDLRRFKQVMEAGERARTDGQPTGRGSSPKALYAS